MVAGAGGAPIEVLVDECGAGTLRTVVLLPSSQRDSRDFDDLAQRLAGRGFDVLRPQPRGMGRSASPPADMTLHVLAADVARTIEAWGRGPAIVAGHAYGHYVARVTDLDHPGLVRGVVVLASAARTFPPGLVAALDIAADPTRSKAERLACLEQAFFSPGNDATAWLDGWHPHLRDIYRQAGATPPKDRWWPVSHAPILDLQGADDPWRPPSTRDELKNQLGDKVTVRLIAGASHALIPEQPAAVANAIAEWADGLSAPRS
jgi:pimeloyl-ACP methyl ester carboxylesterase